MNFHAITSIVVATLVVGFQPIAALADDLALVITNGNYGSGVATRPVTVTHDKLVLGYQKEGYEVIAGKNVASGDMRDLLASFLDRADDKDRIVIHFSGRVVHYGQEAWLLPIDVRADSVTNIAFTSPSLNLVLSILSERPGRAVFIAGLYQQGSMSDPIGTGLGDFEVPQGVLLLAGAESEVNDVVLRDLLPNLRPMSEVLFDRRDLRVEGFLSPDMSLSTPAPVVVAEPEAPEETEAATPPSNSGDFARLLAEQAKFALAEQSGTLAAYQEYLSTYPTGIFADAARAKVADLSQPEAPSAEEIEASLNLSRASRRSIQSNLTYLGFNTRGVDGILGRGSRAAIAAWQNAEGYDATGFVTAAQILELQTQADNRRVEVERDDRRYWDATGDSGRKTDLQLYLDRYPDGIYASEARSKLAAIAAEERADADREAWDIADELDTATAYRRYISDFPEGIYNEVARVRLASLEPETEPEPSEVDDSARATEDRLNLNAGTRLLIEGRLRGLGFNPGTVDGSFDGNTRNAIRAYQASRGIPPTGYLNATTVQALLLG